MPITSFALTWHGPLVAVQRELLHWTCPACNSESEYQEALASHLRESARSTDPRVEREYAHCGGKVDVYFRASSLVGRVEILIEAKLNLNAQSECDRLVGQIERMKPSVNHIIVVLFGETKQDFVDRLKEQYQLQISDPIHPRFAIIQKSAVPAAHMN